MESLKLFHPFIIYLNILRTSLFGLDREKATITGYPKSLKSVRETYYSTRSASFQKFKTNDFSNFYSKKFYKSKVP